MNESNKNFIKLAAKFVVVIDIIAFVCAIFLGAFTSDGWIISVSLWCILGFDIIMTILVGIVVLITS